MSSLGETHCTTPPCLQEIGGDPQILAQIAHLLGKAETALYEDAQSAYFYLDQAMGLLRQGNAYNHCNTSQQGGLGRWQTRRLDAYIRQNLNAPIRTCSLAAQLSLSASHFSHLFKQTFGITPLAYVARIRIEAACRMMLDTDEPLTCIAHAHGFCDQSHFSRTFRREIGISPQAWRQRRAHEGLALGNPIQN